MYRFIVVFSVAAVGVVMGLLIGLIGGAAFMEFGKNTCTGADCADVVARGFIPAAAAIGGLLGLTKGLNLITARARGF